MLHRKQNMLGFSLLCALLLLLTCGTGLASAAGSIVSDDFNSYADGAAISIDGTKYWKSSGSTIAVTAKDDGSGNNRYASVSNSGSSNVYFGKNFSAAQTGFFVTEFDLSNPSTSSVAEVQMYDSTTALNSGNLAFRLVYSGGNIVAYNGTTQTKVVSGYAANKWYHFTVTFDTANKVSRLSVRDGSTELYSGYNNTSFAFYSSSATQVGGVAFRPGLSGAVLNVDNVNVYTPTSLDLTSLTAAGIPLTFNTATSSYSASVGETVESITLTPVLADPSNAQVTINGTVAASGSAVTVPVSPGSNTITVVAGSKAFPSMSKTYTISVNRAQSVPNVTNVTSTPDNGKVTLHWTDAAGTSGVHIYVNGSSTPDLDIPYGTQTAVLDQLTNGSTYTFVLKSYDSTGHEALGVTATGLPDLYPVTGIALNRQLVSLQSGQTADLTATVTPAYAANQNVTWSSTKPSVATVNPSTGKVTAVAPGEAYIIATSADGSGAAGACRIVVSDTAVNDVQSLSAAYADSQVTLHWTDPANTSITAIRIYEVDTVHLTSSLAATVSRGTQQQTFTGLQNGKAYFYKLKGVKSDGSETEGIQIMTTPPVELGLAGVVLEGITSSGTVKPLELKQTFDGSNLIYTMAITNDITKVRATPTAVDPSHVQILVNGSVVASGQTSPSFPYTKSGDYEDLGITLSSLQDPQINRTYQIRIFRASSTQFLLSDLKLSEGNAGYQFFEPGRLTYATNIVEDYSVDKVVLTPKVLDSAYVVYINGKPVANEAPAVVPINEGLTSVTVSVYQSASSTSKSNYSMTFYRYASNQLRSLTVTGGTASRDLRPDSYVYYVDVPNGTSAITLTPTAMSAGASITVNGAAVASGQASLSIPLNVGDNYIPVTVNGTVTYAVYAYRLPAGSDDYMYIRDEGSTITIRNKYTSATFDKTNSNMVDMHNPGEQSIMNSGYGYFLANPTYTTSPTSTSSTTLSFSFTSSNTIYNYSESGGNVELTFSHKPEPANAGPMQYELHYVIRKDQPGVYVYMSAYNNPSADATPGKYNWSFGQTRWSIRADPDKFNYEMTEGQGTGRQFPDPTVLNDRSLVTDTTWRLPDGTIHTKYDYVSYESTGVYGLTGSSPYGLWFIRTSSEYVNGMPTAQEIGTHQTQTTPIVNWTPSSAHFGRGIPAVDAGYKKVWGPMLVYVNKAATKDAAFQDAITLKNAEKAKWPYSWVTDADYKAGQRGSVEGTMQISDGTSPEGTTVILADPNTKWDRAYSSYIYYAKADASGHFSMSNVMPGTYRVYAYQTNMFKEYASESVITVSANQNLNLGQIVWNYEPFGEKLWQIGVADRTSNEYKHGDDYRHYGLFLKYPFEIPNGVDFTIGQSKESTDWEYAQLPIATPNTRDVVLVPLNDTASVWKIRFNLDAKPIVKNGRLTLALAASRAPALKISLNGTVIKTYAYNDAAFSPDDSAVIRSGAQGIYKLLEIPFDASLLVSGENVVTLDFNRTMYDSSGTRITDIGSAIVYDSIKMEIESTKVSKLTLQPGDQSVTLNWTSPTYDGFTGVNIYTVGAGGQLTLNQSVTSSVYQATVAGLTNGTAYTFEVRTVALNGTESTGVQVSGTPSANLSDNANLAGLTLSAGTLSPTFASGTSVYAATVSDSVYGVKVTPIAAESHAVISVNGTAVASGTASKELSLATGNNVITIVVTAQNGATNTYTVTVNRQEAAGAPVVSDNANLAGLSLSAGTLSPTFASGTSVYAATVSDSVYGVKVTPIAAESHAVISVNGTAVASGTASGTILLGYGSNTISIGVTAQNGTSMKWYTITVTREQDTSDSSSSDSGTSTSTTTSAGSGSTASTSASTTPAVDQTAQTAQGQTAQAQTAQAVEKTVTLEGRTVASVTIDSTKLNELAGNAAANGVITVPVQSKAQDAVLELSGDSVKKLAAKEIVLQLVKDGVSYSLPTGVIPMGELQSKLGVQGDLSGITLQIKISTDTTGAVQRMTADAANNGYQVVSEPIEFSVTAVGAQNTVEVNRFSQYVERTIALPQGVSAGQASTGVVLKADGTVSPVPTKFVTKDGRLYAVIKSLTNSTYAVVYHEQRFADLVQHWSKTAAELLSSRLILNGVDDTRFAPDQAMTRAEFSATLVRALGLNAKSDKALFNDVSSKDWFFSSVQAAGEYGLISGYEDGSFKPGQTVTRAEAMVMMARAMKLAQMATAVSEKETAERLSAFSDHTQLSKWAEQDAAACIKAGLVEGSNNRLEPLKNVTRAEAAALILRLLEQSGFIS